MSNWERREALMLVEHISARMRDPSIAGQEMWALMGIVKDAKDASETCATDARRIQGIRESLCRICVSGRLQGCSPANAGTGSCFWLSAPTDAVH